MGRLRGVLWLTAGLVLAALAGAIAYITLSNAAAQRAGQEVAPTVTVVVALGEIEVASQLTAEDLGIADMPVNLVPEGALRSVRDAVGQLTTVNLFPGEVLLVQRLLDPNIIAPDGRLALVLVEDEVLMAFPVADLMSQIGVLQAGDHVDLLFTLDFPAGVAAAGAFPANETEQVTFDLLQNVVVAAVAGPPGADEGPVAKPIALLLTLSPQDALVLKYVMDAGGIPDIVLRPPGVDAPYTTEPVEIEYLIDRYQIPTAGGR